MNTSMKLISFYNALHNEPVKLDCGHTGYADQKYDLPCNGWQRIELDGGRKGFAAKVRVTNHSTAAWLKESGEPLDEATTECTLIFFQRYSDNDRLWILQGDEVLLVLDQDGVEKTSAALRLLEKEHVHLPVRLGFGDNFQYGVGAANDCWDLLDVQVVS
jgi:hypothetical protein